MAVLISANYVTQEVFDANIGVITSTLDTLKRDIGTMKSDTGMMKSTIGTLTGNFNNFVSTTNTGMFY